MLPITVNRNNNNIITILSITSNRVLQLFLNLLIFFKYALMFPSSVTLDSSQVDLLATQMSSPITYSSLKILSNKSQIPWHSTRCFRWEVDSVVITSIDWWDTSKASIHHLPLIAEKNNHVKNLSCLVHDSCHTIAVTLQ